MASVRFCLATTSPPPFVLFGRDHLAALALTAAGAVSLTLLVRRQPGARWPVRVALAALLAGVTGWTLGHWWRAGTLTVWDVLPFHLCDLLILVAIVALLGGSRRATELLYFWAGAGTLLALLWPDLGFGFPDPGFVSFFLLHGLVVVAAAVLVIGLRRPPAPGALWRVFLATNAYAGLVGVFNLAFDTNYLFLCRPPAAPTLLDWMGPWPWYLFAADALALFLFWLLALPWRRSWLAPTSADR